MGNSDMVIAGNLLFLPVVSIFYCLKCLITVHVYIV